MIAAEAYVPIGASDLVMNDFMRDRGPTSLNDRRNNGLMVVGRLRPGMTEPSADAPLAALSRQLEGAFPAENKNQRLSVHALPRASISTNPQDDSDLNAPFAVLAVMAAIVLLIACLNLANMTLARGTARRKEIAMRLALGGGRARVLRQLVTEGFVLSALGGAGGLLIGYWAISLLVSSMLPYSPVPLALDTAPDGRVLVATIGFCALATILFSLGPAWKLSRTNVVPELKEQAGEDAGRGRWFSPRNILVGAQIALSLGLLTTAGLFIRGAMKAGQTDPGYRYDHQVIVSVDTALAGYDEARGRQLYTRLIDRVRQVPGVKSASLASAVAFGSFTEGATVLAAGTSPGAGKDGRRAGKSAVRYSIGDGLFRDARPADRERARIHRGGGAGPQRAARGDHRRAARPGAVPRAECRGPADRPGEQRRRPADAGQRRGDERPRRGVARRRWKSSAWCPGCGTRCSTSRRLLTSTCRSAARSAAGCTST